MIRKIPFSRFSKVQTLNVRFLAQYESKTSRQGRGLCAQNAASQTFEELDRENADPSTERNYFRLVFIIHPRDRPLVLPHPDTKVGRFKVGLTIPILSRANPCSAPGIPLAWGLTTETAFSREAPIRHQGYAQPSLRAGTHPACTAILALRAKYQ